MYNTEHMEETHQRPMARNHRCEGMGRPVPQRSRWTTWRKGQTSFTRIFMNLGTNRSNQTDFRLRAGTPIIPSKGGFALVHEVNTCAHKYAVRMCGIRSTLHAISLL